MSTSRVIIKYEAATEENVFFVTGYVNGDRKLFVKLRVRDDKHLLGMIKHDLRHTVIGLGFTQEEEKIVSKVKLTEEQNSKALKAFKRLKKGQKIELK